MLWLTTYGKDLFIFACIGSLLFVGLAVALWSGGVSVGQDRKRAVWENASRLVVAIAGCLAFLLMIHQFAGIPFPHAW